jgi:hypothetical protein
MNFENTRKQAKLAGVAIGETRDGVVTLRLHDGANFVFPAAPINTTTSRVDPDTEARPELEQRFFEADKAGEAANMIVRALMLLSATTARVTSDARFTQQGRDDALREDRGTAIALGAIAWAKLGDYDVELIEREHALYAVPQIERGDAVAALLDREAREWARSLAGPEREAMLAQITRGEAEAVTLALLRSPVPIGSMETVARLAYGAAVNRRHPEEVEHLAEQQEQLRWAQLLARRAAAKLAELAGMRGFELFEAAAKHTPAMPAGPSVYFSDPAELRAYRTRWQTMRKTA